MANYTGKTDVFDGRFFAALTFLSSSCLLAGYLMLKGWL